MMNKYLCEQVKVDVALAASALNNTTATGRYFDMSQCRRALFVLSGGSMAATKTTKIELLQAVDAAGSGSPKSITGKEGTITANASVTKLTLGLSSVLAGQTVTVNGVVFTAHADTTTAAEREFAIDGNDTADAAALASLINDPDYGVPGVTATANTGTVTLTSDSGATTITASASDSTVTVATLEALAFVEVMADQLDTNNGYTHVAAKVTTTANTVVAVTLLRGDTRYAIEQAVGARYPAAS